MRIVAAVILLVACSKDPKSQVDAAVHVVDAKLVDAPKPIDAAPDAPPDAANMQIVDACSHLCTAIAACFMEMPDPSCNTGCEADLQDCTAQQVMTLDACSTEMCGDIQNEMSPLLDCVVAVSCVNGATNGGSSLLTNWRR